MQERTKGRGKGKQGREEGVKTNKFNNVKGLKQRRGKTWEGKGVQVSVHEKVSTLVRRHVS